MPKFGTPEYDAEVDRHFRAGLPRAIAYAKNFVARFQADSSIQAGMEFANQTVNKREQNKKEARARIKKLKNGVSHLAMQAVLEDFHS